MAILRRFMETQWPKCEVRVNELRNLPHHEGRLVLDVVAPDREVMVFVQHGRYWVDCAITCGARCGELDGSDGWPRHDRGSARHGAVDSTGAGVTGRNFNQSTGALPALAVLLVFTSLTRSHSDATSW